MIIVGADYHSAFQQIAFVDTESGDYGERRLGHLEEADLLCGASYVRVRFRNSTSSDLIRQLWDADQDNRTLYVWIPHQYPHDHSLRLAVDRRKRPRYF